MAAFLGASFTDTVVVVLPSADAVRVATPTRRGTMTCIFTARLLCGRLVTVYLPLLALLFEPNQMTSLAHSWGPVARDLSVGATSYGASVLSAGNQPYKRELAARLLTFVHKVVQIGFPCGGKYHTLRRMALQLKIESRCPKNDVFATHA